MPQHPALLDRRPHRPDPGQGFLGDLTLARGRVHEVCGPARWSAALMIAGGMQGPILWVRPAWDHGHLHGAGMMRFLDPGRVIFVDAPRAPEVLWTMEEALRAGAVPLVVGEMPGPVGLTPMRRMQLACEAGGAAVLGLLLTPEGVSPGAESRWRMIPTHGTQDTAARENIEDQAVTGMRVSGESWRLIRERDRKRPPQGWRVGTTGTGFALGAEAEAAGAAPDRSVARSGLA
ncbi:hypothetical protein [uncultured Maritimibacter sp.]|jgi:protein ImuA|uniref:ImuA family protein n=1 Tax=uncultured Maritimibacter sp. TaxID=991866 RepID=UPI00263566BC|nr:hypothetical protein [uncultured Maritimibacter sp.]